MRCAHVRATERKTEEREVCVGSAEPPRIAALVSAGQQLDNGGVRTPLSDWQQRKWKK